MSVTPEQIGKLPKWAQEHLGDCERRRNTAENNLKDYLDKQSPSFIWTESGWPREKHFIQNDRVTIQLEQGQLDLTLKDGEVECMAIYSRGSLCVLPRSSNVFTIKITP